MADNVEVKLGADASGLNSASKDAASTVDSAMAKIRAALAALGVSSARTDAEVKTHTTSIARQFQEMREGVVANVEASRAAIEGFSKVFLAVTAAIAGAGLFKEITSEVLAFEDSVRSLSITFGTSATSATQMAVALRLAGLDSATFETMAMHVGRQIKTNSEEFDRLKIAIRGANGEFLPMDTVLQNVYKRMLDFKEGTDQNLFAMTAVGRSAKDFSADMERFNAVQERATKLQHDFGIEMGEDRIAELERYRVEMNAFKILLGQVADQISIALMPILKDLASWFVTEGPGMIKTLIAYITQLRLNFATLAADLKTWTLQARTHFADMVTFASRMMSAMNGPITQFTAEWAAGDREIEARDREMAATILGIRKKLAEDLALITGASGSGRTAEDRGAGAAGKKKGTESFTIKPTGGGDPAAEWLAKQKDELVSLQEAQGFFNEMSKAQEASFWSEKLAIAKSMGPAYLKVVQEIHRMQFDAAKQAAHQELQATLAGFEEQKAAQKYNSAARIAIVQQEIDAIIARGAQGTLAYIEAQRRMTEEKQRAADIQKRIDDITLKSQEAVAKHAIDMQRMETQQKVALREIDAQTGFAQESAYLDQVFKLEMQSLEERRAKLDAFDKEGEAKLDQEKLALTLQYETAKTKIEKDAELERAQASIAAQDSIRSGLSSALQMGIQDWHNWRQAGVAALKAVTDAITKMVADQWIKKLLGPSTGGGDYLKKITDWFSGNTGKAAGAAAGDTGAVALQASATALDTAATTISTNATASATTIDTAALSLSTAGVGLNTAAAALSAAAASLAASGASSGIGSAIGAGGGFGFDTALAGFAVGTPYVPQDTLAVVHKGEAIIPAKYNSGGVLGGNVSHGAVNMSFNISGPIDTRTQGQIYASAYRGIQAARARNT